MTSPMAEPSEPAPDFEGLVVREWGNAAFWEFARDPVLAPIAEAWRQAVSEHNTLARAYLTRDAQAALVAPLREALRDCAIWSNGLREAGCASCNATWNAGSTERHRAGCLAALPTTGEK